MGSKWFQSTQDKVHQPKSSCRIWMVLCSRGSNTQSGPSATASSGGNAVASGSAINWWSPVESGSATSSGSGSGSLVLVHLEVILQIQVAQVVDTTLLYLKLFIVC